MNTTTPLVDAAVDDTALEDKNQPHTDWITADAGRKIEKKLNEAVEKIDDLKNKLAKWESELSSVMPPDFKDWHQNSRDEWPEVAKGVIKSLREREEFAYTSLNLKHDALKESHAREAQLRAAFRMSLIRAYTAGNFHGHHTTVDGGYVDVHHSDITTYWAESIDEMLNDGSLPEAQSALSAFTAKHEL